MIEVRNLTKSYNVLEKPAVKDVSLCARAGEITILLGPNGAGKSTTIKSIANLLNYEGEILICGYPNNTIEAKNVLVMCLKFLCCTMFLLWMKP